MEVFHLHARMCGKELVLKSQEDDMQFLFRVGLANNFNLGMHK